MSDAPTHELLDPRPQTHSVRSSCRGCGRDTIVSFLSLGRTALANSFVPAGERQAQDTYPLELYFCEHCTLVQLVDVIDPSVLFRHYLYVSGTSETIRAHHQEFATTMTARLSLGASDLVIEAASNDGNLLRAFQDRGVRVLGVEPARNIAAEANAAGIPTVDQFFNSGVARELAPRYGKARLVIGKNVLAHVDDPADFLRGCATLLADDGEVVIEVPYLADFIDKLEYDTVYHEHLSYFSVTALMHLFERAGLVLADVDELPVHGGSLRLHGVHAAAGRRHGDRTRILAAREQAAGFTGLERYRRFADDVVAHRRALLSLLDRITREGRSVAGWGASAKGNTLLSYCGIDRSRLAYIVDRNPMKVGLYTPGTHIPVVDVEHFRGQPPDYLLILAWNFAEEIIRQAKSFSPADVRFIVPVPVPRVV